MDSNLKKREQIDVFLSEMSLVLLCIIMLYSMKIYIFWGKTYVVYLAISLFVFIRIQFIARKVSRSNFISCFFCFLMYSTLDIFHLESIMDLIPYTLRHVLLVWLVLLLTNAEKEQLVWLFTKIFVVIVGISLVSFTIHSLGVELPYGTVKYEVNTSYPDFKCYPFFLERNQPGLISRFQSVFLEPGHLGMISSLLLYVNGYHLKRPATWILFLAIFASLSLAAYVLLLIGMVLRYVISGKRMLKRIFLSLIYILAIIVVGLFYYIYDPDAAFSQRIVERLDYDENKGISGNNRTNISFDTYYEQQFYKGVDCLFGVGSKEFNQSSWGGNRGQGGNSSYKVFIVQYGLLGIFTLILFFSVYTYLYKSRLLLGLLLLYATSFWQRPYALWEVELFLFIGAAISFDNLSILSSNTNFRCQNRMYIKSVK